MYQIISDGSCDLPQEVIKKYDLTIVPFYVSTDGKTHKKEIEELGVREFYQFMVDNPQIFPKTSMPSIQDYVDAFMPALKQGKDIICICITTKFSGSYNSAIGAKDMVLEKFPEAKISVIDATVNTILQGLLVVEALKMQESDYTYQQTVEGIERIKITGRIFFTVGGMEYLIHGGRVGKLAGIAAGTLGIKPLIVLENGEIQKGGIARGRKTSKRKVIELAIKHLKENNIHPNTYAFCIGYGYNKEEGLELKELLRNQLQENFEIYLEDIKVYQIGATIGVHTGPYPIGVGFIKKQ